MSALKPKRYRVRVNYLSGNSVEFTAESFSITGTVGARRYEWKGADPDPMYLNADQIESVWNMGEVKR
jgi:hypothetical protein